VQAAGCVIVTVCVATVNVPVRGEVVGLPATKYPTVPLPVPELPLVTAIHGALLLTALHAHPVAVVTATV
jgi:hypothetical protein